jgi:iron-sulfur cluster assembly protein
MCSFKMETKKYLIGRVRVNINMNMCSPISVTETAREHMIDLLRSNNKEALLLSVNSKGCGGNSYQLGFVAKDFPGEVVPLDEDRPLIVEFKSIFYVVGTQIDYTVNGLDSHFVFNNPQETGRCGCGQSFTCNS